MTVLENLEVASAPAELRHAWREVLVPICAGQAAARRRATCLRLLEEFGLADVAGVHAELLPYGRQRMLEIARALVAEPGVLLLDEPAAGLNSAETDALKLRLRWLRRPERVMVVIEHDMDVRLDGPTEASAAHASLAELFLSGSSAVTD